MTDLFVNEPQSLLKEIVDGIGGLFSSHMQEVIRLLRSPTPQKVSVGVTADGAGNIGGGFANPNPVLLYQCPMSQEATIHRISVSSPAGTPKTPLATGQAALVGGGGELLFFLPVGGVIAPLIMAEGYASAAHLNSGGKMLIYGDSFAPNTSLRFDIQIIFAAGISQYTPMNHRSEKIELLP